MVKLLEKDSSGRYVFLERVGPYQITSGFGPDECELAVARFARFAREQLHCNWPDNAVPGTRPGTYRSLLTYAPLIAEGETRSVLDEFIGTVMWTCRSPYRPLHKRKNWFIRVSRCEDEPVSDYTMEHLFQEELISFETFRCGGNGGQNVNKVETGVRASYGAPYMGFEPVTVVCTTQRTQLANKREAVRLLRELVKGQARANRGQKRNKRWQEHARLERGHPVAVFEGEKFVRVR